MFNHADDYAAGWRGSHKKELYYLFFSVSIFGAKGIVTLDDPNNDLAACDPETSVPLAFGGRFGFVSATPNALASVSLLNCSNGLR